MKEMPDLLLLARHRSTSQLLKELLHPDAGLYDLSKIGLLRDQQLSASGRRAQDLNGAGVQHRDHHGYLPLGCTIWWIALSDLNAREKAKSSKTSIIRALAAFLPMR